MATHSSILVWETPRTEEPGGLYSSWGRRVGRDLATKPSPHTYVYLYGCMYDFQRNSL